jgi:hypothetical protein
MHDLDPAANIDPTMVPSNQPLRHFVTDYGEKCTIHETNQNEANFNRAQRPLFGRGVLAFVRVIARGQACLAG